MSEAELQARFRTASRAFLAAPSEAALEALLSRYALLHVAVYGSDRGLEAELEKIEWNARNILAGRP
jgi:hypothetical protein